ncbi:N-ethylmaleimide reductase [Roseibium hamelinense]|uniref:N-ethylmaleimide reductase n=1 Tax=Roseibium hamelinense TaxID=150831 RepID=A0A562T818_9HYPH|nr:alkene reductase [Roseibium hamelinense]MTI42798.1 alkene reductase [Roseibium hamelinense]TWI89463.1 N-ethylmaleimide reductase [Roseibium hamelinense]
MSSTEKLFQPIKIGAIELKNRIVMAPLTRNRARAEDDAPYEIHAEYYGQRAGAGLIITEAAQISPQGKGYAWTPGIYSTAQIAGWKQVTDAVHAKGGKIVLQLWHVGRISHPVLQPGGAAPVAPSAISAKSKSFDGENFIETTEPRALETDEIASIIEDYRTAAENAKAAGFDGVEIHAANGYLIDQFIRDGSNTRTDAYGGSIENRLRFLKEVTDAVTGVWGADRVGVRLSPFSNANNIEDSNPQATFALAVDLLNSYGLAYLHLVEGQTGGPRDLPEGADLQALYARFGGAKLGNNGYNRDLAIARVDKGDVDLVAFGRPYIANPDLAERLQRNAPLNEPDQTTFYGGTEKGYTDYPFLNETQAA